jgi:dienelactone hydrolase
VVIFTCQGFDQNSGPADLKSLEDDARACYVYLQNHYPHQRIAVLGYSLGAVTGICLGDSEQLSAYRRGRGSFNPKTVVADKKRWIAMPFSSMFSSSVPDELDTAECLWKMRSVPILFLHNPADPLAPYSAAQTSL